MTQDRKLGKARLAFGFMAGIAAFLIPCGYLPTASAQEFNSRSIATYTAEQAAQGKAVYAKSCASCHGQTLGGSEFASALNGMTFSNNWGGKSAGELFTYINTKMPPATPGNWARRLPRRLLPTCSKRTEYSRGRAHCPRIRRHSR